MSEAGPIARGAGFGASVARLAVSLLALLETRGRLAGCELIEERERLVLRLALAMAGLLLLALALSFAGLLVVAVFWDTHRVAAIAGVGVAFLVAGAVMVWRARAIGRAAPPPFAATLAELEKDRACLLRHSPTHRHPGA